MAPEIAQVSQSAVEATPWEVALAAKAASRLVRTFPHKPAARIKKELIASLLAERTSREGQGLNHWRKYAPAFLKRLVPQWSAEERRRLERVSAKIRASSTDALKLAFAITDNLPDGQRAVSDSNLELLTGACREKYYLLSVKRNSLDIVRRRQLEQGIFVTWEEILGNMSDSGEDAEESVSGPQPEDSEPATQASDELDPLEILLRREEAAAFSSTVASARKHRRWRFCKRKKWARPLLENVPKCASRSITK